MNPEKLNSELGNIDLFLLDQLLKGRVSENDRILDAGCGEGRNLLYFLRNNYKVHAVDPNPSAIKMVQMHARTLGSTIPATNFLCTTIEESPYEAGYFDVVFCFSLLHHSTSAADFHNKVRSLLGMLKDKGTLLLKMEALKGVEDGVVQLESGLFNLPDGSSRYLMTNSDIKWITAECGMKQLEPVKIEMIENQRSYGYLVLQKV